MDLPVKRNARKQELASKEMPLHEKEMVIRIQRCIGVMYREERRQFTLPVQQFLIEFEYCGVIRRTNSERYKRCYVSSFFFQLKENPTYYDRIFCP